MTIIPLVLFTIIAFALRNKTWSTKTIRVLKVVLASLMVATVVVLAINAVRYLLTPAYFEYGEENIASVAAYWLHGHPIYHSLKSADRYSLLYGPLPTLLIALFQKSGWNVFFASKLPGVLCVFLTLFLTGALVYRHRDWSQTKKLIVLATLAAILIDFYNASYWDRPDPFILVLTVLSLFLAEVGGPAFLLAIAFGVIGGCLGNCKINAVIDVIPAVAFFFERKNPPYEIGIFLVFVLTAAATGFGFFLIPGVSLHNFLSILLLATQELNLALFRDNFIFLLPFVALLLLSGFQSRYRLTFYAFFATLCVTMIIGCKTGGGLYYFMPYVPLLFYFSAIGEDTLPTERKSNLRRFAVCCFLGMFWLVPQYEGRTIKFYQTRGLQAVADLHDLRALEKKYPGPKSMGVTGGQWYAFYFTPELISRGGRMLIDMPALMDFHLAHIKIPESTYHAIANCEVEDFILPSTGEPWTSGSIYHHQTPLFSQRFRDVFATHYKKIDSIGRFALYRCSRS